MSEPILPLQVWPEGILQARIPANDNALRLEALSRPCLGVANDAAGGDADGDVWLVGSTPTGAFAAFDENDIALYHVDPDTMVAAWYAWAPVEGVRLVVNDVRKVYMGGSTSSWEDDPSITGGGSPSWGAITGTLADQTDLQAALDAKSARTVSIVTEASTSTMAPATHSGLDRYVRAADDVTFNASQSYTAGQAYNIRATAALTLIGTGVTLTPPSGGTLDLSADMAVMVVMTTSSAGDVIGQTVPA